MFTLNSLDGQITSGGINPPINVEFPATNYNVSCNISGSISYIDPTNNQRRFLSGSSCTYSIRTNRILAMSNITLRDLGLLFNIPKPEVMPKFIDLSTVVDKIFPVKTFKVYFGTPSKPYGAIVWIDDTGQTKNEGLYGTTVTIKATKIIVADNVRIEDLSTNTTIPVTNTQTAPVTPIVTPTATTPVATVSTPTVGLSDTIKNLVIKIFNDAKISNLTAEQYYQQNFK